MCRRMGGRCLWFLALVLAGTRAGVAGEPAGAAEGGRPFRILTSFYPVYLAVLNVAGDVPGVQVTNLTRFITGCLHDYQLMPADMVSLARADLLVVNGAGMESFLDKAVSRFPKLTILNASEGLDLLRDGEGHANAHVWVSVSLAMRQVEAIAGGLALADPVHAEAYRHNAAAYLEKLDRLRGRMKEGLRDIQRREIITFHEAFPYFAREFGLKVVAVIDREPGSEPGARELADTIGVVRRQGVKVLFVEPQYPSASARTVAREAGAEVYTLDSVVTGPARADAYLEIMERNLKVLQQALR